MFKNFLFKAAAMRREYPVGIGSLLLCMDLVWISVALFAISSLIKLFS